MQFGQHEIEKQFGTGRSTQMQVVVDTGIHHVDDIFKGGEMPKRGNRLVTSARSGAISAEIMQGASLYYASRSTLRSTQDAAG